MRKESMKVGVLANKLKKSGMTWEEVTDEIASQGFKNTKNKPYSINSVYLFGHKVRKLNGEPIIGKQKGEAQTRKHPSTKALDHRRAREILCSNLKDDLKLDFLKKIFL